MAEDTTYLKYEAESMLDFLKAQLTLDGKFTDQLYDGSNMSIILETLSSLFEVFTYQLNFQASEATFNGVQIYENMLKIVSPLGYKARASMAPVILGTITGNVDIKNTFTQISTLKDFIDGNKTLSVVVSSIEDVIKALSSQKILTRDLEFYNPQGTAAYTLSDNVLANIEYVNLSSDNIFYWINTYPSKNEAILKYLQYLWGGSEELNENDTITDVLRKIGKTSDDIKDGLPLIPNGLETIPAKFNVATSSIDNFVTAINGQWNSTFITNITLGLEYEKYNVNTINVDAINITDGTIYAVVYSDADLNNKEFKPVEIYKAVSSLRNYTANDMVFEYYVDVDKTITIKFGNGIYGKRLEPNKTIVLYYIVNNGKAGEIAKSAFTNGYATFQKASVLVNSYNTSRDYASDTLNNRFIYNNIDLNSYNDSNPCNILSQLLTTTTSEVSGIFPKVELFFSPIESSSKATPIETVDEIRSLAPLYNRTNDRIITRNDLYTVLKREYVQYIYDVAIMNNYDYMAKFYSWLYRYNRISKDIATLGYKFADSCDFNNVYCWLKGYSKYDINDFIKKSIERDLLQKKILTAELVFLDPLNVCFYTYVGNIYDDIEWLLECANRYLFCSRIQNVADINYKKWWTIQNLFDKDDNGNIIKKPTRKFLAYLLSNDNNELKIELQVIRDSNINENSATIKTNILNIVNEYFNITNRKLGEVIKLNEINSKISSLAGIKKISTVKQKNIAVYTSTIPHILPPLVDIPNNMSYELDFNETQIFNDLITFNFQVDTKLFEEVENVTFEWILFDKTTGKAIKTLDPYYFNNVVPEEIKKGRIEKDGVVETYSYNIFNDTALESVYGKTTDFIETVNNSLRNVRFRLCSQTEADDVASIFGFDESARLYGHTYQIYLKCKRLYDGVELVSYTNKMQFTFLLDEASRKPTYFRVVSALDNTNELSVLMSDSASESTNINDTIWQTVDSMSSLSFAKWTTDIIDCEDFEVVGSGHTAIEDFGFPTLFKDIGGTIKIYEDESNTVSIEY